MPIDIPVISHVDASPIPTPLKSNPSAIRRPMFDTSPFRLKTLFTQNRLGILATYTLFAIENLLRLAQPFALGWAINDLLNEQMLGVGMLIGQHVLHLLVGLVRQVYDTRMFSAIYSALATQMIVSQRASGVDVSRVTARASLSSRIR